MGERQLCLLPAALAQVTNFSCHLSTHLTKKFPQTAALGPAGQEAIVFLPSKPWRPDTFSPFSLKALPHTPPWLPTMPALLVQQPFLPTTTPHRCIVTCLVFREESRFLVGGQLGDLGKDEAIIYSQKYFWEISFLGPGERVQWVKSLPWMHEGLNSIPRTHMKNQVGMVACLYPEHADSGERKSPEQAG